MNKQNFSSIFQVDIVTVCVDVFTYKLFLLLNNNMFNYL